MTTLDPIWSGVRRIAQAVTAREISATEVVQAHLARMEALEPGLNAFIIRNPKAVVEAEAGAFGAWGLQLQDQLEVKGGDEPQ